MFPTRLWTTGLILAIAALLSPAAADTTKNPELVAQLKATGTQSDRLELLPNDATDWTFDFAAQDGYTFSPASVVNANTASWPVRSVPFALSILKPSSLLYLRLTPRSIQTVVGNKLTMAMIQLGPCGMLPPHYHPRASNYVVAVTGKGVLPLRAHSISAQDSYG
jgi:Cupin